MVTAYEGALATLHLTDRNDPITELIAKRILDAVQSGERDPSRIRERALEGMEPTVPDQPARPETPKSRLS